MSVDKLGGRSSWRLSSQCTITHNASGGSNKHMIKADTMAEMWHSPCPAPAWLFSHPQVDMGIVINYSTDQSFFRHTRNNSLILAFPLSYTRTDSICNR